MEGLWSSGSETVLRATVVLVVAVLVAPSLRRRSAAARHVVWAAALVAVVAMPFVTAVGPRVLVPWSPLPVAPVALPAVTDAVAAPRASAAPPVIDAAPASLGVRGASVGGGAPPESPWGPAWTDVAVMLWAFGAGIAAVVLWRRIRATRAIVAGAAPGVPRAWRAGAGFAASAIGLARAFELRSSTAVASPWVWDAGRAVVVVPQDAAGWDAGRCRAAMVHELAHVRRRDGLVWLVGCVAAVLFWFHPLVWFARRRLFAEQERACDDTVLAAGCVGSDYAAHLLELSREPAATLPAVAMARQSEMAARLVHLLDPRRRRSASAARAALLLGVPLLSLGAGVGVVELDTRPHSGAVVSRQDPQQDPEPGIGAQVQRQIALLGAPATCDAALEKLRALGAPAVPFLTAALAPHAEQGATPQTRGILSTLAALGTAAAAAAPEVEKLAHTTIPMRKLALATLAALRGEAGWTWVADYSDNCVLAFDPGGKQMVCVADIYGAWDLEVLEDGALLIVEFAVNRVREIGRDGVVRWEFEALRNPYCAQRLPNGNTLIANTFGHEVLEVDREGEVVWKLDGVRPMDAERLANGNTLIADGDRDRILEVDADRNIVRELRGFDSLHDVDALPGGHLLITQRTLHRVVEVDADGEIVWQLGELNSPSDADRLPNGHTLVAENGVVREFDADGKVVWKREVAWAVEVNRD